MCMKNLFSATCFALIVLAGSGLAKTNALPSTNGNVEIVAAPQGEIVSLSTKLIVPAKPPSVGTLFLWPGLQPALGTPTYYPMDNGVLQSVLTWGPSCAPGDPPGMYSAWWISAQYVNTYRDPKHPLCYGGPIMAVSAGDTLLINISLVGSLFGTFWVQTVLDLDSKTSVSFEIGLEGQEQNLAFFSIEPHDGASGSDTIFLGTTISFASSDSRNCRLEEHGIDDAVSEPILLDGGRSCYIDRIALKAPVARPKIACPNEDEIRSTDSKTPTTIIFRNEHGSSVNVYWTDYDGHHRPYGKIANGKSLTQFTYLAHPWVVTDSSDTCIGLYLPAQQPTEVVIH